MIDAPPTVRNLPLADGLARCRALQEDEAVASPSVPLEARDLHLGAARRWSELADHFRREGDL